MVEGDGASSCSFEDYEEEAELYKSVVGRMKDKALRDGDKEENDYYDAVGEK